MTQTTPTPGAGEFPQLPEATVQSEMEEFLTHWVRDVPDEWKPNARTRALDAITRNIASERLGQAWLAWLGRATVALRAQGGQAGESGEAWQPIATAPKDGTDLALFAIGLSDEGDEGPTLVVGRYSAEDYGFIPSCEDDAEELRPCVLDPTHWMPLPAAQAAPSEQKGGAA